MLTGASSVWSIVPQSLASQEKIRNSAFHLPVSGGPHDEMVLGGYPGRLLQADGQPSCSTLPAFRVSLPMKARDENDLLVDEPIEQ